jgi:hypothetical protein
MVFDKANEKTSETAMNYLSKTSYRIEAMIFCGRYRQDSQDQKFILKRYAFKDKEAFSNKRCEIYLPKESHQ